MLVPIVLHQSISHTDLISWKQGISHFLLDGNKRDVHKHQPYNIPRYGLSQSKCKSSIITVSGIILMFWLWAVNLNRTTGEQRSHVIKVITIISNHLLVHAQGAIISLFKPSSLHFTNLCGGKEPKMICEIFAVQSTGKKALVIMEKVGITHTSLVSYKHARGSLSYAISSPNVTCSFLSMETLALTHLFHFSLPECLSHHCIWWKNHKPNQGNRCERHKQLYQSPLQLSSASLGYTRAKCCWPFLGPQGMHKLTTNQTFHLVPEQNNLCKKYMHYSS